MIDNKRGIAMIVSTLLIVLLVIVAVGIIWGVFRGTVEDSTGQFEHGAKCLEINVKATAVNCVLTTPGSETCDVTLNREVGGDAIDGVRVIFFDGSNSYSAPDLAAIPELETSTASGLDVNNTGTGLTPANIESIEVAVFFNDASGDAQLCSGTNTFSDIQFTS